MKSWMHPKLRVFAFLLALNLGAIAVALFTLDRTSWFWFTPIVLSINVLLFTYDYVLDFTRLRGETLLGRDRWGLLKVVHDLSAKFETRPPEVILVERDSAQIFSYSRLGRRTRLIVTAGALRVLDASELEAVLTYQFVVAKTSHAVINYWLGAAADLTFRTGRALERGVAFVFGWAPPIAIWLVRPATWLLHFALLSPADFDRLDRETAARLAQPADLARALWKMDAYAHTRPWAEPWVFAHMCMVSPLGTRHVWRALRIQPPVQARIRNLAGRFPL